MHLKDEFYDLMDKKYARMAKVLLIVVGGALKRDMHKLSILRNIIA